jgi:hypothetical protein
MRAFAIQRDMQGAQGQPGRFSPRLFANAPHSSACVARAITDLLTGPVVREAALRTNDARIALP